jgi:hypothetical protein
MSKGKTWRGFDYNTRKEVVKTREEWRADIQLAFEAGGRKVRVQSGDLLILVPCMGTHKIIAEVYDRE